MKITLNGESREIAAGATVADLVRELKLADRPIAVELNREILPKTRFPEKTLSEDDQLEIVHFVGGG